MQFSNERDPEKLAVLELELSMERTATLQARIQRDEAVQALREIYANCGEDPSVAEIANRVLTCRWANTT